MKNKVIFFTLHEKSEGSEWQQEEQRLAGSRVDVLRVAVDKRTDLPNSDYVLWEVGVTVFYSYREDWMRQLRKEYNGCHMALSLL